MDEQSIWKKEISFRRKPKKEQAEPETSVSGTDSAGEVQGSDPETGPKESPWKREISFGRKPKQPAAEQDPVTDEEPAVASDAPQDETETEEPLWQRAVSFTPKTQAEPEDSAQPEPVAEERVEEEAVVEEPVAEETVAEDPVAEEPVAEDTAAEDTGAEEAAQEEPVVAAEAADGEIVVAAEEPAQPEPVAEQPVPEVAAASGGADWYARPAGELTEPTEPAAPVAVHVPSPVSPANVVHPPVPASALPQLEEEKVPFWKKDISFGGKKGDKAPKSKAAKPPKKAKASKAEKQPKQPKEKAARTPKVKAARGSRGAKRIVGLKIGASQLAAARVANNGSAELLQVARERLEPGIVVGGELRDPEALATALKSFFDKHGLPKRGVRLGIANNRIGVRTFEIEGIADEKQLGNAIRFRAQEALPIPIDEAVLDYHVLSEGVNEQGQSTRRILLVVAYRELIDRYVDACKKAGLVLDGIDLEAFALLRALQAPQDGVGDDPSAALVAVSIGHERSTFAVSDGRVCEFTRVLEWGGAALNVALARVLDAAPSEVEYVKHELTLTNSTVPEGLTAEQATKCVEALRRAIQTFARELVSSLQYYQNQPGSLGIGEIVLTGGTAHLPGLAGELEGLIGVRVRVGDPLARMKVAKKVADPEQVGSFAIAIGLGIED